MALLTYDDWLEEFQGAARRDGYREMDRLCELAGRCGSAGDGEPLMSGTVSMVAWLAGVEALSCEVFPRENQKLYRSQQYHASGAKGVKYIIVVESDRRGWARLLWNDLDFTDLADFHSDYVLRSLYIRKTNLGGFRPEDHQSLMEQVEDDIHFDFGLDVKVAYTWASDHFQAYFCSEEEHLGWIERGTTVVFYHDDQRLEGHSLRRGKRKLTVMVPTLSCTFSVPLGDVLYTIEGDA